MICPKCDLSFEEDKKFCRNCGRPLVSDLPRKKLGKEPFFTPLKIFVAVYFVIITAATIFAAKYFFSGDRLSAHLNTPAKQASNAAAAPAPPKQLPKNDDMALRHGHGPGRAHKSESVQVKTEGGEYETTAALIENGSDNLGLRISIKPNDAVLFFDGQMRGYAPLDIRDLLPGKHVIGISKPGYKTRNITVNLVSGVDKECTISLEKKQADIPSSLRLVRDPLGADRS
jgi:PEGA domain